MSVETLSFIVRCWREPKLDVTRLQVIRVDQAEEIRLTNSNFLVRVTTDRRGLVERCYIRHIASGREEYVQGGPGLRAFVKECLLGDTGAESADLSDKA